MTAKLELYDGGGQHNSDLGRSASRIIQGTSWKKQRIVCVIPADQEIPTKVALALRNLQFPPNQGSAWIAAEGYEVGDAYSTAISMILAHPDLSQWDYLLTVEHDNLPPYDGVMRLLKRMDENPHLSVISGGYWTKGPEGVFQCWGDKSDPIVNFRPQPPDPNGGLVECYGTGMGFALFRLKMFKDPKLRRPWFETTGGSTQDLYFAADAVKHGYRFAVDCSVKVGHFDLRGKFGPPGVVW